MVEKIMTLGMEVHPNEACGIILPNDSVVMLDNVSKQPTISYIADPEGVTRAFNDYIEECPHPAQIDIDSFIIWHTHPSGQVGPSEGDLEVMVDGFRYLVVTIPSGEAVQFESKDFRHG